MVHARPAEKAVEAAAETRGSVCFAQRADQRSPAVATLSASPRAPPLIMMKSKQFNSQFSVSWEATGTEARWLHAAASNRRWQKV